MLRRMRPLVLTVIAMMAMTICIQSAQAASDRGTLEGVVKNASGQPVTGAFVKLKNAERKLTFMVISQAQGRYTANDLPAGNYTVQGVGNGFQSDWSKPVAVAVGKAAKADLSLTGKQPDMLPAAWPGQLPVEEAEKLTLPEGAGKKIVSTRCTSCHDDRRIVARRVDKKAWEDTVKDMRERMVEGKLKNITDEEANTLVEYLAASFPAMAKPDPNSRLPKTLMKADQLKYRVVQYQIADGGIDSHDVAVDPQGNGWINQRLGGKVGRFDPSTLQYMELDPPKGTAAKSRPGNPQVDAKGRLWVPDPNNKRWLALDTKTLQWDNVPFPTTVTGPANGNSMSIAPDGTIWSAGPGAFRSYNPDTKKWSNYDTPTYKKTKENTGGYGIAVAGDGRVWMAQNLIHQVAVVDPKTGEVREYKTPVPGTPFPRRMNSDAKGDVWVGLWQAGKMMRIDHKTGEMATFDPPTARSGAYSVSVDKTRNLPTGYVWITLQRVDKIARFNPKTQEWTEFPLPEAEMDVRRIEVDQKNPNRIWWTGTNSAKMGFIELLNN